jgi:hypothetical protein
VGTSSVQVLVLLIIRKASCWLSVMMIGNESERPRVFQIPTWKLFLQQMPNLEGLLSCFVEGHSIPVIGQGLERMGTAKPLAGRRSR